MSTNLLESHLQQAAGISEWSGEMYLTGKVRFTGTNGKELGENEVRAALQLDKKTTLLPDWGYTPPATGTDLKIVSCDDWEGLYIGDKLVSQNHSLNWPYNLQAIENTLIGNVMVFSINQDWMETAGMLPEHFSEIPEGVLS